MDEVEEHGFLPLILKSFLGPCMHLGLHTVPDLGLLSEQKLGKKSVMCLELLGSSSQPPIPIFVDGPLGLPLKCS